MEYKLTIDGNMMQTEQEPTSMSTLKRWKHEGRIDLIEANAPSGGSQSQSYGWPGSPAKPAGDGRFQRGRSKKLPPGSLKFGNVSAVLFPTKDSQKLNMAEINNVAHIIKHHTSKNEFFVTDNRQAFLDGGRREHLKSYFGIIAVTSEEAVETLVKINGWK